MDLPTTIAEAKNNLSFVEGQPSEAHQKVLELVKRLKTDADNALTEKIDGMKRADEIYHAFRAPDEQDKKSKERGEPVKLIYPVSFAQVQTTSAVLGTVFDRDPFYSLEGTQPQSFRGSKLLEVDLQYQLEQSSWNMVNHQWIQDMLKYGFGALHCTWDKQMVNVRMKRPVPILGIPLLGQLFGVNEEVDQLVTGYEGASFDLGDPYTMRFDPSVSVGNIQKGQYVFHQTKMSKNEMKMREDQGEFFNVDKIPKGSNSRIGRTNERDSSRSISDEMRMTLNPETPVKGGDMVILDICYIKLVPRDYSLAPLNRMQIWKVVMANDAVIVQAEPSRHEHGQFPTLTMEYLPDQHELVNDGMVEILDGMQSLLNWLLNSHIENVKKVIHDVLIVDPSAIEIDDLKKRNPIIRLKPGHSGDIRRYIQQLNVQDVTQSHVGDAQNVFQFIQRTTGVSDNIMGVQLPTARTATEVNSVQRLAAGRITLLAKLMWEQGYRPLGKQLIQNSQQFMSQQRFVKVAGGLAQTLGVDPKEMIGISPEDIQGFFNIKMIDATTPTDKMFMASKLQEFLLGAMQAPQMVPLLGLNLQEIAVQMFMNFGIRNTSDFMKPIDEMQRQQMMQQLVQSAQPKQAQVMPDAHVMDQVQRGNLVPQQ